MMSYLYLLAKFLAAGSIVVGVSLLAQKVDPRYGGILAAAPITTTLAFIVLYSEAGQSATRELVLNAFYFAIPTVLFLLVLWFLLERTGFAMALGGAFLFWVIALGVIEHRYRLRLIKTGSPCATGISGSGFPVVLCTGI